MQSAAGPAPSDPRGAPLRPRAGQRLAGRKRPKTDRLDARWLVLLLIRELLPDAWLPPEDIQRLRDQTRLRKALSDDHTGWAQRVHSLMPAGPRRAPVLT